MSPTTGWGALIVPQASRTPTEARDVLDGTPARPVEASPVDPLLREVWTTAGQRYTDDMTEADLTDLQERERASLGPYDEVP